MRNETIPTFFGEGEVRQEGDQVGPGEESRAGQVSRGLADGNGRGVVLI